MDIGEVREVEQIVEHQPIAALDQRLAGDRVPVGVGDMLVVARHQVRIGLARIAHPDEHPAVALDHGIGLHPGPARHLLLAGHVGADAVAAEHQAVIAALDLVADQPAFGKRQVAVRAAVLQRDRGAVEPAEQHDVVVEQHAAERRPADILRPGRDIPVVPEQHRAVPFRHRSRKTLWAARSGCQQAAPVQRQPPLVTPDLFRGPEPWAPPSPASPGSASRAGLDPGTGRG